MPAAVALVIRLRVVHRARLNLMLAVLILALTGFMLVAPMSASARARDEVMAGAYHCAGIASTRLWLDCYYGAAQAQRAELGLTPAPPEQVNLSYSPQAGGTRQNQDARDDVMASAGRCGSIADGRQWLGCYYAAAVPVRAALGLSVPPAGAALAVQAAQPEVRRLPPARPGILAALLGQSDFHMAARMASYDFNRSGHFTVTLANGQQWRQVEGDTTVAQWRKPAAAYLVNITGGALGSYNLAVKGLSGKFKVHRVH
jgi:hypothetical protein